MERRKERKIERKEEFCSSSISPIASLIATSLLILVLCPSLSSIELQRGEENRKRKVFFSV